MRRAGALLALALTACAPSIPQLVERHHYREALCAIGAGSSSDDRLIVDSILGDLDPKVELSVVDLRDRENRRVNARGLQVRVATNALPVDALVVHVSGASQGVVPADIKSLAAVTGEALPAPRTVSPGLGEGLVIAITTLATLGIVRIEPSRTRTEYPSTEELEHAAPRASFIAERHQSSCETPVANGVAARCTYWFVIRDEVNESVSINFAFRIESRPEKHESCGISETAHLALGRSENLGDELAQRYLGFRRVDEVATWTR